jgi:drug/metabolite transporter (DMT)-like permease
MIGYVLQFQGQRFTTSSNAALIISTAALMVPIIALVAHAEILTRQRIVGVVTGFLGTALVITRGVSFNLSISELTGDFMILGTAITIALIFVLSKPLTIIHGGRPITGAIIMMTFLLLIPATLLDFGQPFTVTVPVMGVLIYLAVFATLGAYYFFTKGLETVTPVVSSIILPVEVMVAVFLSVVIFADLFNIISAIGATLILAGVFLVTARSNAPSGQEKNKILTADSSVSTTGVRHS